MKDFSPLLTAAAMLCLAAGVFAQDPATQLVREAQAAYQRGDLKTAKAKFESAAQLNPHNQTATAYLRLIRSKEGQTGGAEAGLGTLVPSVKFKDAELSAVLDALRQQVTKLSDGKQSVNFVIQLSEEQAKTPITLSLEKVPFPEVLKYIGQLANVTFTFDKYAILVRPAGAAQAQAPAPTPEAPK